jgi:mRNA interferase RelE/StbE
MNVGRYELIVAPSARRQLSEELPEAVAFAAFEFIVGPLLDNPHRVGKRLRPPLEDRHSARRGASTGHRCRGLLAGRRVSSALARG